jgi:ATP-dependent Clp protease ATP-binding subunit ClpB
VTDEAHKALADEGYDPLFGARPLKRTLQQRLENPLAVELLQGRYPPGSHIVVDCEDGKFSFNYAD